MKLQFDLLFGHQLRLDALASVNADFRRRLFQIKIENARRAVTQGIHDEDPYDTAQARRELKRLMVIARAFAVIDAEEESNTTRKRSRVDEKDPLWYSLAAQLVDRNTFIAESLPNEESSLSDLHKDVFEILEDM